MAGGRRVDPTALQEELPSDSESNTRHDSVVPQMVELRLSTGQGTTDAEVIVVCDLWIGEGTLYDPETRTEVNVWFDKGYVHLRPRGCVVKGGTRFADLVAPEGAVSTGATKIETISDAKIGARGLLDVRPDSSSLVGNLGLGGHANKQVRRTTVTTRALENRKSRVSVTGDSWEITPVGLDDADDASIEKGCKRYRYIDVNETLCNLEIRPRVKRVDLEASFYIYPSSIRYRIKTDGAVARLRDRLTTNQSKIVDLLLKKGVSKHDDRGIRLAKASLRRTKKRPRDQLA